MDLLALLGTNGRNQIQTGNIGKTMSDNNGHNPAVLFFALVMAISLPLMGGAQKKRAMASDDLIRAIRISDPQLSPDGRRVLYVRTATALESGQRNSDIWMVPADGSRPPAQFIGGEKNENSPRFLPDGKGVLFISTRDGAAQIYRADAE